MTRHLRCLAAVGREQFDRFRLRAPAGWREVWRL